MARTGRVRVTPGLNTIASDGVLGNPVDEVVVLDDFLDAEPTPMRPSAIPEPARSMLMLLGLLGVATARRRVQRTG